MIVLTWSLTALAVLVAFALLALGIELNRRDYQARDRAAALAGGAVVPLAPPFQGDAAKRRAA
jgi:hypothetical protein